MPTELKIQSQAFPELTGTLDENLMLVFTGDVTIFIVEKSAEYFLY